VGFLPETPPVYADMTVGDYLAFAGKLRGMSADAVKRRVPAVEELTHLTSVHEDPISTLSHGFRQRVGVAQAIVHEPKLLILDEPTRGLDPVQIVEMRNMIRTLKSAHTILVSSHVLTEVSETCDRLLVLGSGAIVGAGTEAELSKEMVATKHIVVAVRPDGAMASGPGGDAAAKVTACLEGVANVTAVKATGATDGALTFQVTGSDDVRAALCRALVEAGHGVIRLDRVERQLESIFLQLVHGSSDARN
jgi:ABC-2 type transport system ATP-binding protein